MVLLWQGQSSTTGSGDYLVLINRRLFDLGTGLAQRRVEDLAPGIATVGECLIQVSAQCRVTERQANTVILSSEGLTNNLQGVGFLRSETEQDGLIGSNCILSVIE